MFRGYVSFREGTSSKSGCMWMFYRYLPFFLNYIHLTKFRKHREVKKSKFSSSMIHAGKKQLKCGPNYLQNMCGIQVTPKVPTGKMKKKLHG